MPTIEQVIAPMYFRDGDTVYRVNVSIRNLGEPDLYKMVGNSWVRIPWFNNYDFEDTPREGALIPTAGNILHAYEYAVGGLTDQPNTNLRIELNRLVEKLRLSFAEMLKMNNKTTWNTILDRFGFLGSVAEGREGAKRRAEADKMALPRSMWPLYYDMEDLRFRITGEV